MNTKKLIKACLKNKQLAQQTLFSTYYTRMYHLSRRYLVNHHNTEDALMNSFIRVFNNLKNFNYSDEESLGKWISTIVVNESIRILNKQKPIILEEDITQISDDSLFENYSVDLEVKDLYKIIENLPTGYRTVFNLYIIEGYTHKEIAEMLNINENTSKSQLRKARRYLKNKIIKDGMYEVA